MNIFTTPNIEFFDTLAPLTVVGGDYRSGKTFLLAQVAQRHRETSRVSYFTPSRADRDPHLFGGTHIVDLEVWVAQYGDSDAVKSSTRRREIHQLLTSAHSGDIVMIDESASILHPAHSTADEILGTQLDILMEVRRGVRIVVTQLPEDYDDITEKADVIVEMHGIEDNIIQEPFEIVRTPHDL